MLVEQLLNGHFSNLTSHFDVRCSGFTQDDSDVILLEPELDGVADDVQLLRQRLVGDGCRLVGHH